MSNCCCIHGCHDCKHTEPKKAKKLTCEHGYTSGHRWAYKEQFGSMIPYWCEGPNK